MASRSSTIPSMHIKLSRPGGETRRTSFPRQPSWPELETRIATLFGIPLDSVAVTYEDSDGDIVTLSSQEELVDYLAGVQRNEPVKFNVINTKEPLNSSPSTARPSITENASEGIAGGITSLGPTMIYELDEPEWQRIPGMPNVFSMREPMMDIEEEPHAFVEVIDSEANSPKKGSATPVSVFERLRQEKGKGRAESEQTKSTSSASIVEDDVPFKSAVHVYDAHGAAIVDPIGLGSAKGISPQTTPRQASTLDLETPPPGALPTQTTGGTATGNTFGYSEPPSFIGDVAHLVDGLTRAFASHPELSEGLRNIVKNTVEGVYWEQGSRSVNEAIHNAAQETSANINRSARDLATHSEEAVVKSIAEALGGVFRVIGDITSVGPQGHHRPHSAHHGRPHHHHRRSWHSGPPGGSPRGPPPSEPHHGSPHGIPRDHLPPPPSLPPRLPQHPPPPPVSGHHVPPHPPPVLPPPPSFGIPPSGPPFHYGPPPRGPPFHGPHRGGPFRVWSSPFPHRTRSGQSPPPGRPESPGRGEPPTFHHGDERGNWPHSAPMHGDPFDRYRTELPYYGYRQRPHDNLEYDSGHYRPQHWDMDRRGAHMQDGSWGAGYDQSSLRNVHESKAQLETAKAVYKAEKERFREEKEERRRLRREYAERRAEEGHPATEGTREETIVARIPLTNPAWSSASRRPYAEVYSVPTFTEPTVPAQAAQHAVPAAAQSVHVASPQPTVRSIHVPPPPPPVPVMPAAKATLELPVPVPVPAGPVPMAPLPWPVPPTAGSSRMALSSLRDRILARLFEMGITNSSQPELMDILDGHANRTTASDDEILADVIAALNINSRPSPRPHSAMLA